MAVGDRWALVEVDNLGNTQAVKLASTLQAGDVTFGPNPDISIRNNGDTGRFIDVVFPDISQFATRAEVDDAIQTAVDAVPDALETLNEISETLSNNQSAAAALANAVAGKEPVIEPGTIYQYWRGDKTWQTLDAATSAQGAKADSALQTAASPLVVAGTQVSMPAATTLTPGHMTAAQALLLSKTQRRTFVATSSKTVGNSAAETTLVPSGVGSLVIPSAVFDTPGYSFRFTASGVFTNTIAGAVTLKVKVGSQVTLQISSLALPVLSNKPWYAEGTGTVRSGRTVVSHSMFNYEDATTKMDAVAFSSSSIVVTAGDKTADLTAQWNLVILSAGITVEEMSLDIIPPP